MWVDLVTGNPTKKPKGQHRRRTQRRAKKRRDRLDALSLLQRRAKSEWKALTLLQTGGSKDSPKKMKKDFAKARTKGCRLVCPKKGIMKKIAKLTKNADSRLGEIKKEKKHFKKNEHKEDDAKEREHERRKKVKQQSKRMAATESLESQEMKIKKRVAKETVDLSRMTDMRKEMYNRKY